MKYSRLTMTLCLSAVCSLVLVKLPSTKARAELIATSTRAQNPKAGIARHGARKANTDTTITAKVSNFNGDLYADLAVYRPPNSWYVSLTTTPCVFSTPLFYGPFGSPGDIVVAGDYDNDDITNLGLWQPSIPRFAISEDPPLSPYILFPTGVSSDTPLSGDFDGDEFADYALIRAGTLACSPSLAWYLYDTNMTLIAGSPFCWGLPGDRFVPGDYDNDDRTDLTVFRNGTWYWLKSSGNFVPADFKHWGTSGDISLLGDFDGDDIDDQAVFRPSTGVWYILRSSDGTSYAARWGISSDIPVPADYDGDMKTDVAVFRPNSNGASIWYILPSDPAFSPCAIPFGTGGDRPIPAEYVK